MAKYGQYLNTPMMPAIGCHSEDGVSIVISDNGTEEADNEIRRICFGEVGGSDDEDGDVQRRTSKSTTHHRSHSEPWNQWTYLPTRRKKDVVLRYFSYAKSFRVITLNSGNDIPPKCCFFTRDDKITEMQITDRDGCPLFDAWLQRSPWPHSNNRWVIETCGNIILTIQQAECVVALEKSQSGASTSSKRAFSSAEKNSVACHRWSVHDWNGEILGYLVASGQGEALFLETADKETVGKFLRQCTLSRKLRSDSSVQSRENFSRIRHRKVQRSVRLVQKATWTCVHAEREQRLMRLENEEIVFCDVGTNLASKLLMLAGTVKIVGDLQCAYREQSCGLFADSAFVKA